MNILFISRTFPPNIGGMENYSYNLHKQFNKKHRLYNIILKKNSKHLIWFYPWIYIYGSYLILTKKIDVVYIGDGLLSACAVFFQKILRKNVLLTIYGLDVIFNKFFYQSMQRFFLPKIKNIIAISEATANEAVKRGVLRDRVSIIPVGIEIDKYEILNKAASKYSIAKQFNLNLNNKKVLFTIGRLVKRKGVYWFIDHVAPKIKRNYVILIAGFGSEYNSIKTLIINNELEDNVFLLGRVNDEQKNLLYSASDCFISPNISVKNDMEGFGIVNLEAGMYGLPVVASNIEGVKDAIVDGVTGYLVTEQNSNEFVSAINKHHLLNKNKISSRIESSFSWENIFQQYNKVIHEL